MDTFIYAICLINSIEDFFDYLFNDDPGEGILYPKQTRYQAANFIS